MRLFEKERIVNRLLEKDCLPGLFAWTVCLDCVLVCWTVSWTMCNVENEIECLTHPQETVQELINDAW